MTIFMFLLIKTTLACTSTPPVLPPPSCEEKTSMEYRRCILSGVDKVYNQDPKADKDYRAKRRAKREEARNKCKNKVDK